MANQCEGAFISDVHSMDFLLGVKKGNAQCKRVQLEKPVLYRFSRNNSP
jgi:hypothetical protein